ncbi:hypothetical protein LMG28614_05141 [Paraburkholderia ultramafica]|uniref:Uncharacterized protein n=1 Tax=Paraburkholderia ultramafica TaxID=1544867 RepID=A0A6S7DAT2_9BURK|nr:hypothetical protein LMG28614_05141 [Paraburkholderia ultramafica]
MKIAARRGQFAEPVAVVRETMGDEMDHLALVFPFSLGLRLAFTTLPAWPALSPPVATPSSRCKIP